MALYLSAEKKNLKGLFDNDERFVIPAFQRPYRWTKKEVKQLFDDITDAFSKKEDYFVGNIVVARGDDNLEKPQIVDGQQRILTLWLFLKVLSIVTGVSRFRELLFVRSWNGSDEIAKVDSQVFEEADQQAIDNVLQWSKSDFDKGVKSIHKNGLLEANALQLYKWVSEYYSKLDDIQQNDFWNYIIKDVYLLPIILGGKDMDEAMSRALTIFETINNRGLDLADADILKSKLYEMAGKVDSCDSFISQWRDLGKRCLELNVSVDTVFRYYLRILRAKEGLTTSEPNLRNFFLNNDSSPFRTSLWSNIMGELSSIVNALETIDVLRTYSVKTAILYQVMQEHPSDIPNSALVTYVYSKRGTEDSQMADYVNLFLEELIRICYTNDPTQDIKYVIFDLNVRILHGKPLIPSNIEESDNFFDDRKKLYKGFVLLYHYLVDGCLVLEQQSPELKVVPIAREKDASSHIDWPVDSLNDDLDNMANFSIIDFPKSYKSLDERSQDYNNSHLPSVHQILMGKNYYSYHEFEKRKKLMQEKLRYFLFVNG